MTKAEKHLEWLKANKALIRLAEIERRIGMTRGNLQKTVAGALTHDGYPYRIPERCLPELYKVVKELRQM